MKQREIALHPGPLLDDQFNGSAINTGVWTVTDTDSKLTVSGGNLVCAGGLAIPAWGDPQLIRPIAYTRAAGRAYLFEVNPSAQGASGGWFGLFSSLTPGIGAPVAAVRCRNATLNWRFGSTPNNFDFQAFALNSSILWLFVDTGTGWRVLSSTDGVIYNLRWIIADTTTPIYAGYENNDCAFTSSYCRIYQGHVKPPRVSTTVSITPTLGSELLTDPGWEGNYTAGQNDNATKAGLPTLAQSADVHGGSKAQQMVATANNDAIGMRRAGLAAGGWYQGSGWVKRTAGAAGTVLARFVLVGTGAYATTPITGADYAQFIFTGRKTSADELSVDCLQSGAAPFDTIIMDDFSIKAITLASCLSLAGDPGTREGVFDCAPTLTAGTQCGMTIGVDDETNPTYGLFAYHDGTNAHLVRLENGTWQAESINAAATYSAAAQLRVVIVGQSVGLYYNGAQIGTTQTIDTSAYGTKLCGFSTYASNTCGTISHNGGIG